MQINEGRADVLAPFFLQRAAVAAVGDELVDLPLFHRVGLAVAVADGVPEVKAAAHWITLNPGGTLIGFSALSQGVFEKNRHACSLMTGVLRGYWRRGVATALMERALDWVGQRGITRVELTVMEGNDPAVRLYEKFGFEREGVKRSALMVDGGPVNEICMARLRGE